ncbi:MAG: phospholipid carrier-dependent glycosyltransferase [Bacteroidetes bacterium]|nr:phospholipid carrier-dependent glycosyltransferase [Bacteroidota bacterium]
MAIINNKYLPGLLLFLAMLIISLFNYKDYGVAYDEPIQREMGIVSYKYAFEGDTTLNHYSERDHGTAFEVPLIIAEKIFHLTDSREIYLSRHLITHLFFLLSALCLYVLALRLFDSRLFASMAFLLLVCNPRIYAHSFFNSKDLPFLSAFLISLLLSQIAFSKEKLIWFTLLGIGCGYTSGIRIMGIMLVSIIILLLVTDIFKSLKEKRRLSVTLKQLSVFLFSFCATIYISWPYLWANPIDHAIETFQSFSKFRWDGVFLFMGKDYFPAAMPMPLYYIPVWFCITTPLFLLLTALYAITRLSIAFIKNPSQYLSRTNERNYLLYAACFIAPVLMIIVLHSVVYDDWRHMYFIYPPFILVSLYGIKNIKNNIIRITAISGCLATITSLSIFMIEEHPYQQVYFNRLVSHKDEYLRKNYDLEYWGLSIRESLEYILQHDNRDTIRVYGLYPLIDNNKLILPKAERERIKMVWEDENPDYLVTVFRGHKDDFTGNIKTVYERKMFNSTFMRVYKFNK